MRDRQHQRPARTECCLYRLHSPLGCVLPFSVPTPPCHLSIFRVVYPALSDGPGAAGARLLGLFLDGITGPLLADLLFVFSPILWERALRHTSLAAHFFILAALYFYFLGRRSGRYCFWGLFALNILTITIHPYFVPMTYAVTFALLLEYAVSRHRYLSPALWLLADLALTVAAGWMFGLFTEQPLVEATHYTAILE